MAEPTPVAPSPDGGSGQNEPTNLNSNPQPSEPAPQSAPQEGQPSEHTITLSEEDFKFWKNNGGAKKLIPSLKKWIGQPESQPQPAQPADSTATAQPQNTQPSAIPKAQGATQPPAGALAIDEVMAKQYFKMLADDPKFANISKELQDGTLVKDLADFGVPVMVDGYINDAAIRRHVERYALTKPATQPTNPEGSAPTVSYTEATDGKVENYDQALKIINENGNPNRGAALKFLANMGRPQK